MKTAILSDIHANLEALQAVLARAGEAGCGRVWCLGDTVGYGANPNDCCDLLRSYWDADDHDPVPAVLGNHDEAVAHLKETPHFNRYAAASADWTRLHLTEANLNWLASLPLQLPVSHALLTHGSVREPREWHYLVTPTETGDDLEWFSEKFSQRFYCVGHSHYPFVHSRSDGYHGTPLEPFPLEDDDRYCVNAGSVGQPRDGDSRASFAIYDEDAETLEIVRVEYDVTTAQRKILEAGLPPYLAERLAVGH